MAERINLTHTPPDLTVYASVYQNVQNASFLRDQLLAGNTDFEYAFLDASMVLSRKHVLAATFRALNDYLNDRLKSKNVHSEIVFCLSPNNNIGEAFRRFGVQETTTNLVVLKIATDPSIVQEHVDRHLEHSIKGDKVGFDDTFLSQVSDLGRIKKVYKLNTGTQSNTKKQIGGDAEAANARDARGDLEVQVLGLMALRGAA